MSVTPAMHPGALTGVRMTVAPSVRKTSSKAPEYLASRSRIRNRIGAHLSSNEQMRFRACWETHASRMDFDNEELRLLFDEAIVEDLAIADIEFGADAWYQFTAAPCSLVSKAIA
jgi:hypothetical protein